MGLGGVAIAILPSIICLKLTFSDGLGGVKKILFIRKIIKWLIQSSCVYVTHTNLLFIINGKIRKNNLYFK